MPRIDPKTVDFRPWWWHGVERHALPEADPPSRVQAVVIGAGSAGLAAAALLAERGTSVLVLDSRDPADGTSARTLGMVGAAPSLPWTLLPARFGAAAVADMVRECRAAYEHIKGVVAEAPDACDLSIGSRYLTADSARRLDAIQQTAAVLSAGGCATAMLGPLEIAQALPGGRHVGGARLEGGTLDPYKLAGQLLRRARDSGVEVASRCGALSIRRVRGGFDIETEVGGVVAETVLVTTGLAALRLPRRMAAPGGYRRTACFLATEPAPPEALAAILPEAACVEAFHAEPRQYRLSADRRRLLVGGLPGGPFSSGAGAFERLADWTRTMFPQLAQIRVAHAWTAQLDFSYAGVPRLGGRDGLNLASGAGWAEPAMAVWLGRKLALRALGDPQADSAFDERRRPKLVHRAFAPWLEPAGQAWAALAQRGR
jgi:glycine/D-amino acid oxidase-like deaminating enzyme